MKLNHIFQPAPGLYISDLEYHEQGPYAGYITAYTTFCGRHVRETVFRVHDPQNKRGMCLIRIEQSHLHPAARRYWNAIEQALSESAKYVVLVQLKTQVIHQKNERGI